MRAHAWMREVLVGIYNMRVQCEELEQKIYDKNRHPSVRFKNDVCIVYYYTRNAREKNDDGGEEKMRPSTRPLHRRRHPRRK